MSYVEIYSQVRATYNSAKKQRDLFLVRYLYRPPSFALATVFIIGGFSANQVTGLNLVILLIGMALIPSGTAYGMLVGSVVYFPFSSWIAPTATSHATTTNARCTAS